MPVRVCLLALVLLSGPVRADEVDGLLRDIRAVSKEAGGAEKARSAWEKLVRQGPGVLPRVLAAMDTPDTVAANWLRTAFDRIVETALEKKEPLNPAPLLAFAKDRKHEGRARRLALDLVERLKPGSRASLLGEALEDPEFRFDAIDQALQQLAKAELPADEARSRYQRLLATSRDQEQARRIASALKGLKVEVSVAEHLGFLRQWRVIGPFDGNGRKGFGTAYPPEQKLDLKATLDGKDGKKLTWKRYEASETWTGRHQALVDLRQPLGDAEDAVAYAFTTIKVKEPGEVEFRGAADDNFTVWVNGERVFAFEEYRNGVRFDRHRFKVKLRAGVNSVLVKVCQSPSDETNREPNWEFLLRACDETGKGIALEHADR
jgi:hypothetical protein